MTEVGPTGATLDLHGLHKTYGDVIAVDDVSLQIGAGELVTLLGPSGSGKTTTLAMIAGFIAPDAGAIVLDGTPITGRPPHRRGIGFVFQNYALFPHMTVEENIAFPLKMRRASRHAIEAAVREALRLVRLEGMNRRLPRQLSGGQQQRIALARAVVFRPRLLLMDEPLGALDKALRESLQLEIMQIVRSLGATLVYVTHDQDEALLMSDRVALFNRGRIEQVGGPRDLYAYPRSIFAAQFLGESTILRGWLELMDKSASLHGSTWQIPVDADRINGLAHGDRGAIVIRPELMSMALAGAEPRSNLASVSAKVEAIHVVGPTRRIALRLDDSTAAIVREQENRSATEVSVGATVQLQWQIEDAQLVPGEAG